MANLTSEQQELLEFVLLKCMSEQLMGEFKNRVRELYNVVANTSVPGVEATRKRFKANIACR